jgi:hypothetical protein
MDGMPVENKGGSVVVTGAAVDGFRVRVILSALELYIRTGMKANRLYTPTNMRNAASGITGKTYARSQKGLKAAAEDLRSFMDGKTLDEIGGGR